MCVIHLGNLDRQIVWKFHYIKTTKKASCDNKTTQKQTPSALLCRSTYICNPELETDGLNCQSEKTSTRCSST